MTTITTPEYTIVFDGNYKVVECKGIDKDRAQRIADEIKETDENWPKDWLTKETETK